MNPLYTISFLPYIICIPISLYGINLVYQNRSEIYIMKRNSSVVLGWNYALIFTMFASCFSHIAIITHHHLSRILSFSLFFCGWWCCFLFLITKNWILFFKSKWTHYTLQCEWHQLINSTIAALETQTNWYLKNHYKYGNTKYMLKLFTLCGITLFIIDAVVPVLAVLSHYDPSMVKMATMAEIITFFPPIIFYSVIVCKRLRMNDSLFIEWEYSMYSKILSIAAFGFVCGMAMRAKTVGKTVGGIWAEDIIGMTLFPFMNIACFMLSFVSTFMVIKKNKHGFRYHAMNKQKKGKITFNMILSHKTALNIFVKHLSKQFSMECLLSYIEFGQYQKYLLSKEHDTIDNTRKGSIVDDHEVVLNVPQSEIIVDVSHSSSSVVDGSQTSDGDSLKEYKLMAYRLYEKYVKSDCEFEINISSDDRDSISDLMKNKELLLTRNQMTVNDLYYLFQTVKDEMYLLLEVAYLGFMNTDEFGAIKKLFEIDP